jgi:hypothetical protein
MKGFETLLGLLFASALLAALARKARLPRAHRHGPGRRRGCLRAGRDSLRRVFNRRSFTRDLLFFPLKAAPGARRSATRSDEK